MSSAFNVAKENKETAQSRQRIPTPSQIDKEHISGRKYSLKYSSQCAQMVGNLVNCTTLRMLCQEAYLEASSFTKEHPDGLGDRSRPFRYD